MSLGELIVKIGDKIGIDPESRDRRRERERTMDLISDVIGYNSWLKEEIIKVERALEDQDISLEDKRLLQGQLIAYKTAKKQYNRAYKTS